jgi:GTP pyrophosphokinase
LQTEIEKREIDDLFEEVLKSFTRPLTPENVQLIQKAYHFASSAHMGVRRRSGEPYIIHPLSVAKIVVNEMGLGTKSAVAAILHDVVEDTEYTVQDIEKMFGSKVSIPNRLPISGKC